MSTSATQSGTTLRSGGSGRLVGMAAAMLALVIAFGIVFALNQGNEATVVDRDTGFVPNTDGEEYLDWLNRRNDTFAPNTNADSYLDDLNRASTVQPHPAENIERTKIDIADSGRNSVIPDQFGHELPDFSIGARSARSPLQGVAE